MHPGNRQDPPEGNASDPGGVRLSVLVPVYNWDVSALLGRLVGEADGAALRGRVEVIVIDDGSSDPASLAANAPSFEKPLPPCLECSRLERNLGRSAIRNLLAARARGEFILFLDCDVLPDGDRFLLDYLERADEGEFDVVCGGVSYRTRILNDPAYDYHAYLGNRKEAKSAAERNREPWRHILTSNVMVRKEVFLGTPFDERFTGYGYEDIEWGVRLARKCRILHIDNTVSHLGLVTKEKSYQKMRDSVGNYLLLRELAPHAFSASALSRLVAPLARCGAGMLGVMDRVLGRLFSHSPSNTLAFLFFQLNFAVLLAAASRRGRPGRRPADSGPLL